MATYSPSQHLCCAVSDPCPKHAPTSDEITRKVLSTPVTPPDSENVAAFLAFVAHDPAGDYGKAWTTTAKVVGNTVEIDITPHEDGVETGEATSFRAVVVEGDETPIVLEQPTELGLSWYDGGDLLTLRDSGIIRLYPRGVDEWDLRPDEARELATQLAAMANLLDAAEEAGR